MLTPLPTHPRALRALRSPVLHAALRQCRTLFHCYGPHSSYTALGYYTGYVIPYTFRHRIKKAYYSR